MMIMVSYKKKKKMELELLLVMPVIKYLNMIPLYGIVLFAESNLIMILL